MTTSWWTPTLLLAILAAAVGAHASIWLAVHNVDARLDVIESTARQCLK
jgi:hypothetical protein